jgi:hypothetical protein
MSLTLSAYKMHAKLRVEGFYCASLPHTMLARLSSCLCFPTLVLSWNKISQSLHTSSNIPILYVSPKVDKAATCIYNLRTHPDKHYRPSTTTKLTILTIFFHIRVVTISKLTIFFHPRVVTTFKLTIFFHPRVVTISKLTIFFHPRVVTTFKLTIFFHPRVVTTSKLTFFFSSSNFHSSGHHLV